MHCSHLRANWSHLFISSFSHRFHYEHQQITSICQLSHWSIWDTVLQFLLWLGVGSYNFMRCTGEWNCLLHLFVNLVLCSWLVSLGGFTNKKPQTPHASKCCILCWSLSSWREFLKLNSWSSFAVNLKHNCWLRSFLLLDLL